MVLVLSMKYVSKTNETKQTKSSFSSHGKRAALHFWAFLRSPFFWPYSPLLIALTCHFSPLLWSVFVLVS